MKLTIYYTFFFLLACGLNSCGEEDILTAEEDDRSSYFMPSPDATDEESVLRRNFYEEEHSYLLFNDTLRHEPLGIDFNGNMQYFTEVLDLSYNVGATSTPTVQYSYTYLSTLTEKQAAVDFMKAHVLNHLNESLRPYSWFLVREISSVSTMDGTLSQKVCQKAHLPLLLIFSIPILCRLSSRLSVHILPDNTYSLTLPR